jgi:hypothetical protein
MPSEDFRFTLGQRVKITCSGETGEIVGRAEYVNSEPCYYIRYARADGVADNSWWAESALEAA